VSQTELTATARNLAKIVPLPTDCRSLNISVSVWLLAIGSTNSVSAQQISHEQFAPVRPRSVQAILNGHRKLSAKHRVAFFRTTGDDAETDRF
jgi:hypothetical protein